MKKLNRNYKNILMKFFLVIMIFIIIISTSYNIAQNPPTQYHYTNDSFGWRYIPDYNSNDYNILLDQHSHSTFSDGILTVEQNILWHIAHGFNAMFLTDHGNVPKASLFNKLAEKYKEQIIIMPGEEWTTGRIHLNLLGIKISYKNAINQYPTNEEICKVINFTHNQGGIVVVNHIPWSLAHLYDHPSRNQLLSWGVDYIELINGEDYDTTSESWCYNPGGFGKISGTDMHGPMNVSCWTLLKADNFSSVAIMEQIQLKNTEILFNPGISQDQSIEFPARRYLLVKPLISIGTYFFNPNNESKFNYRLFIVYFIGVLTIFTIIEVLIYFYPAISKKVKEKKNK